MKRLATHVTFALIALAMLSVGAANAADDFPERGEMITSQTPEWFQVLCGAALADGLEIDAGLLQIQDRVAFLFVLFLFSFFVRMLMSAWEAVGGVVAADGRADEAAITDEGQAEGAAALFELTAGENAEGFLFFLLMLPFTLVLLFFERAEGS